MSFASEIYVDFIDQHARHCIPPNDGLGIESGNRECLIKEHFDSERIGHGPATQIQIHDAQRYEWFPLSFRGTEGRLGRLRRRLQLLSIPTLKVPESAIQKQTLQGLRHPRNGL